MFGLGGTLDAAPDRRDVSGRHNHDGAGESNDHLASIYESQEEQFEAIVPFIEQGLQQGERCLYVADDNTEEEIRNVLREGGIDVEAALDSGALSIHTKADTYLRTGEFEQEEMLDFWRETLAEARDADGYTGVRAAAEMTWALDSGTNLDRLVQYEAMLNTVYSGDDYAVLCQYNRDRFPTEVVSDVIRSHPLVVYDGTVCQNFHYHSPDEFFEVDHPSLDVDRTVDGLVSRARMQQALEESERQLRSRIHQQETVAELSQHGLESHDVDSLLTDVTEQVVDTLEADYCTVLKLHSDDDCLVREVAGCQDGTVGEATESRSNGSNRLVDRDASSGISAVVGSIDDPWGAVTVYTRDRRSFSKHDAAFVQSVANTVATAIERAEHERHLRDLYDITSDPDRSFEEKLDALFDLGSEVFDLELGGLARVDPETDRFEVERTSDDHEHLVPGAQMALSETYCRLATSGDEAAVGVSDPVRNGFEGTRAYEEFGVMAYLGTSIELDGDLDRTFFFVSSEAREDSFSDTDRTFHHLMGQWIESQFEQKQRAEHLAALNTLSREVMQAKTQLSVSETIIEAAETTLDLPVTAIALYDRQEGELRLAAATDAAEELLSAVPLLDRGDGAGWNAFVQNESRRISDPLEGTDTSVHPPISEVSLFSLDTHGVFITGTTVSEGFAPSTCDFVETVAANTEAALGRAYREQQLHEREETLTEQKERLERLDRINDVIRSIDQALVQASSREEVVQSVCDQLASADAHQFAWIGTHDAVTDTVTPEAWAGSEDGFLEAVTVTVGDDETDCPTETTVRTGDAHAHDNLARNPPFEPWRQAAVDCGHRATVAVPLCYRDTQYGVLTLFADQPNVFSEMEKAVLAELGETIGYALNALERKMALVSEESVELEFRLRNGDPLLFQLASEHDCEIEFESIVRRSDGSSQLFFLTRGISPAKVLDFRDRTPEVETLTVIRTEADEDETLFGCQLRDSTFLLTLLDRGAMIRTLSATGSRGHATIRVPRSSAVREFVELFETQYETVELLARREVDEPIRTQRELETEFQARLTDRQEEVLNTAYASGFFDWPREMSAQELATMLGISQPTVSRHVRAGERKLFELLFGDKN